MNYPFNKQAHEVLRDVTGTIKTFTHHGLIHREKVDQVAYAELTSLVYQGVNTRIEYEGIKQLANQILTGLKED